MKICVYAICKNEEKNVNKWVKSMSEADDIYVLDTGSTDDTYSLLKEKGVHIKRKKLNPFRFDVARNLSLEMIDKEYDLYVCTDLDERFEKGWRKKLEDNYDPKYTRYRYIYNWAFKNKKPSVTFILDKIHNKNYKWINPVHEVLSPLKEENMLLVNDIVLNHHQLYKKERNSYLPLLELSIKENPLSDRNMHYLGREYMYYKMYDKAIETLHKHLHLKSATWKDERCASMRFIARCYKEKGYYEESAFWYSLAITEAPYLKDSYVEYAFLEYLNNNYQHAINLLDKAFEIKEKPLTYIHEQFSYNGFPYDIYAICSFYLNDIKKAKEYTLIALTYDPNNKRLKNNLAFFDKCSMENNS